MNRTPKKAFMYLYEKTLEEMYKIVKKKNNDYTKKEEAFGNFEVAEKLDICNSETGLLVRMSDKFARIINLLNNTEAEVTDEKIGDTLMDLANYAIILKIKLETNVVEGEDGINKITN